MFQNKTSQCLETQRRSVVTLEDLRAELDERRATRVNRQERGLDLTGFSESTA
jgi:hypothetical protein